MNITSTKPIEEMAAEHAKTFALAVYQAYENSFDKLAQMEDVLRYLYELLEDEPFFTVLHTLHSALDIPLPEEIEALRYDENALDNYILGFMCDFEDMVLSIGMEHIESGGEPA